MQHQPQTTECNNEEVPRTPVVLAVVVGWFARVVGVVVDVIMVVGVENCIVTCL